MRLQKNLSVLITVVFILILSLIAVQLYWVRNAFKLQQRSYDDKVSTVLKKTAAFAQDEIFSFNLYGRTYIQPGQGITILKAGTPDTINLFNIFPYESKPDTCFYSTPVSMYDRLTLADITIRFEYRKKDSTLNIPVINKQYNELTIDNYRGYLDDNSPISGRLKISKIDSAINSLLSNDDIQAEFSFGLKRKGAAGFEYISDSSDIEQIGRTGYTIQLLANREFTSPYELYLYIHNNTLWAKNSITWALALSGVVIIMLLITFAYFSRKALQQGRLSDMKTSFINNMTHEFMTPVTNIALALETLDKTRGNAKDEEKLIEVIGVENEHLKDNINKVLQVALLDNGGFMLNPSQVNVEEVLKRTLRSFDIAIKAKNGSVTFNRNAVNTDIVADETHIINLFYNIIDNAIKYADKDCLQLVITTENSKGKLSVSIEDNGQGMTGDVQKHMFDNFYRGAKGNRHDVKGFGLGLSYVKKIADAHDIHVEVKSTVGKGTEFIIWFNLD